jgi:hypothetical protein
MRQSGLLPLIIEYLVLVKVKLNHGYIGGLS